MLIVTHVIIFFKIGPVEQVILLWKFSGLKTLFKMHVYRFMSVVSLFHVVTITPIQINQAF